MKRKEFNDELDILIYNYFSKLVDIQNFSDDILDVFTHQELFERYLWLKQMNIDPSIIHLNENHKSIYEVFDKCNYMFNENNIEYYYTSGILSYLLVEKELQRYHHDLDIFVNMKDLEKLEKLCRKYGFSFERKIGERGDGSNRVMLKMYYEKAVEIPITIFMYVRNSDNSIEQNDYFIENGQLYLEKTYNSPLAVELSFSDEPKYHNLIKYYAITLEALYLSKIGNRPKDIYDCEQFEHNLDLIKLKELKEELINSKPNKVFDAREDLYYDFIFGEYNSFGKVLFK